MANTYTLIASSTVGSGGAANIEFTSIPGTYTDLKMVVSARGSNTGTQWNNMRLTINSLTTNQSWRYLRGFNNSVLSGSATSQIEIWVTFGAATANSFGNADIYIPNYASSNDKSFSIDTVTESNDADAGGGITAGLWSASAAITTLSLAPSTGNFAQYSTAYLYGIKNS
jgi:hypothetical protein